MIPVCCPICSLILNLKIQATNWKSPPLAPAPQSKKPAMVMQTALLVHAKASEEEFCNEGYGEVRVPFMYNYFVIVGPEDSDPGRC